MEVIEEIDDVIGFKKGKDESVEGEIKTESNKNMLAILILITGIILIILNLWAYTEPSLQLLTGIPVLSIVGLLLIVIGLYVWYFYRQTFRIIVTSMRVVVEFFSKKFKQGYVRDYHYRFFESIEVVGNTRSETARISIHLTSGDEISYVLPKKLISSIIEDSRMFVGVQ